jgi:uncharacterized protein
MTNYFLAIILFFQSFLSMAQIKDNFDIARSGTLKGIKALYKKNPKSIDSIDKNGSSMLILASYRGNMDVAKFIIKNTKNIDYASEMGTALMGATYKAQLDLVTLLLDNKANPNATDSNGTTALMLAVQMQKVDLVNLLLKYKADKTLKTKDGKTAFEFAVFSGNETIINTLK